MSTSVCVCVLCTYTHYAFYEWRLIYLTSTKIADEIFFSRNFYNRRRIPTRIISSANAPYDDVIRK